MRRKIVQVALVLVVLAAAVDYAQACRWRHRSCCCVTNNYYFELPAPEKEAGSFKFVLPYDFTVNSSGLLAQPAEGKFAIQLEGEKGLIATFAGEEVKFSAICQLQLSGDFYAALEKTANATIYQKAIVVPLKATVDAEGFAEFDKKAVYEAVHAELMRIRFWDQPALFGIEKFKIEITGTARIGSFVFGHSNSQVLPGKVK